ncbi:hypothetical protein BC831DRAFT_235239 [Entophlyctis helioformis]|nr:hypothetical protein BC831DRAFT_235239 [Entophlyctis helioformis]
MYLLLLGIRPFVCSFICRSNHPSLWPSFAEGMQENSKRPARCDPPGIHLTSTNIHLTSTGIRCDLGLRDRNQPQQQCGARLRCNQDLCTAPVHRSCAGRARERESEGPSGSLCSTQPHTASAAAAAAKTSAHASKSVLRHSLLVHPAALELDGQRPCPATQPSSRPAAQPPSHPAARPSVCLPDRDRKQHLRLDRPLTAPASRACSDLPLQPSFGLSTCQPANSWGHIHGETRDSGLSTAGGLVGRSVSRPVGQSVRWLAAVQVPFGSTECGPLQSAMAADLNPDPPRSAMADRCAPWGNHDCKRGLAIGSLEQQAPAASTSTSEPRRVTSRLGVQRLASVSTVSTCCTCVSGGPSVGRAWLACGSTSVAGRGTQPVCEQPVREQPPTRARLPSRAAGKQHMLDPVSIARRTRAWTRRRRQQQRQQR